MLLIGWVFFMGLTVFEGSTFFTGWTIYVSRMFSRTNFTLFLCLFLFALKKFKDAIWRAFPLNLG